MFLLGSRWHFVQARHFKLLLKWTGASAVTKVIKKQTKAQKLGGSRWTDSTANGRVWPQFSKKRQNHLPLQRRGREWGRENRKLQEVLMYKMHRNKWLDSGSQKPILHTFFISYLQKSLMATSGESGSTLTPGSVKHSKVPNSRTRRGLVWPSYAMCQDATCRGSNPTHPNRRQLPVTNPFRQRTTSHSAVQRTVGTPQWCSARTVGTATVWTVHCRPAECLVSRTMTAATTFITTS